jgi:16S rRNA (uracil1498-N3)-methyltransferase
MRVPRFYIEESLAVDDIIALPSLIHRHAIQVLRLNVGESLILFNGQGGEYYCQIQLAEKRKSSVLIQSFNDISRESRVSITLVQSLIKPEKMDFCIQKSVELGVTAIQPIIAERTVVRIKSQQLDKKIKRWEGIITAACEQSGRTKIPTIHAPIPLAQWLENPSDTQRIMMLPEATDTLPQITLKDSIELLVGPEGGFTDQEVALCRNTTQAIQFGSRILRAETAAIAGLSLLQAYSGNL